MNTRSIVLSMAVAMMASPVFADGRTVARVFWQDDADATVRCGDLKKSADGWSMQNLTIDGFPNLDQDQQSLVQMRTNDGLVLVGVHDTQDGMVGSGWVAIESGVVEEPHGDHSHWNFIHPPTVRQSLIDTKQGNPAHVYKYGDSFVLANDGKHVVFSAGKGAATKLCWIDASAQQPSVMSIPIELKEGESLSTPTTMRSRYGDTLAVMFGQNKESPQEDRMLVVNLDPNRDGQFDDAKLHQIMDIGPNQIVGHSGYHSAAMLSDRRHVLITNPGDGSLWVISLSDCSVIAKLDLGGSPTRLLVTGG